jgi:hypothetical protein
MNARLRPTFFSGAKFSSLTNSPRPANENMHVKNVPERCGTADMPGARFPSLQKFRDKKFIIFISLKFHREGLIALGFQKSGSRRGIFDTLKKFNSQYKSVLRK